MTMIQLAQEKIYGSNSTEYGAGLMLLWIPLRKTKPENFKCAFQTQFYHSIAFNWS